MNGKTVGGPEEETSCRLKKTREDAKKVKDILWKLFVRDL